VFYRKLVAEAAGVIDRTADDPKWPYRVDPEILNVGSVWTCPLGQVFKNYNSPRANRAKELARVIGVDHAFDNVTPVQLPILNAAWRREILRRRQALARAVVDPMIDAIYAGPTWEDERSYG